MLRTLLDRAARLPALPGPAPQPVAVRAGPARPSQK